MIPKLREHVGLLVTSILFLAIVPLPKAICNAAYYATNDSSESTTLIRLEDDPWQFNFNLESWQRIEIIQKYPLLTSVEPDWQKLVYDDNPYVRAALALAIGRARQPELISILSPLLFDEFLLTRKCALCALIHMKSPLIKEPLLHVISSWEDLIEKTESPPGFNDIYTLEPFFNEIGLPKKLLNISLMERQVWLQNFDAASWNITFKESGPTLPYSTWDNRTQLTFSLEKSHWNAGDKIKLFTLAQRPQGGKTVKGEIFEGRGRWYEVSPNGQIRNICDFDDRQIRFYIKSGIVVLEPGENIQFEIQLKTPPMPGVYLLYTLDGHGPGEYFLTRVQRSETFEKSISGLLQNLNKSKIDLIGQHRVKAAVPQLIEIFIENGTKSNNPVNWWIANAFARIQDPRAIPVLLEYTHLRDWDVMGDTSRALREFGPLAYPYYEQRILSWKDTVTQYMAAIDSISHREEYPFQSPQTRDMLSLEMSLRLLGSNGSEDVDQARLDLVNHLASEPIIRKYKENDFPFLTVFRETVLALASNYPDQAVEAIWSVNNKSQIYGEVLSGLRQRKPDTARWIYAALWQRLQDQPETNPEFKTYLRKIITDFAPSLFTENTP